MRKATVQSSSDVALVKYWGRKDEVLRLPENGSISLILDSLYSQTTVEFRNDLSRDEVTITGLSEEGEETRVSKHLDRIRALAGVQTRAKVNSVNNFPPATGLSSSGSGFSALTRAGLLAAGLDLNEREISILARQGSGTACRCSCGGIVEWKDGDTSEASYAESLYASDYWDIRDVIAVVSTGRKDTSSSEGHTLAKTSPLYSTRLANIPKKLFQVKELLAKKAFEELGEVVEQEALEFHSILFTSTPSLFIWLPGTIEVIREVRALRTEGVPAYFTISTGFNVHVLTLPEFESKVEERLRALPSVINILKSKIGDAPKELQTHLF
ncbi:MAG: Diphosphomevalonate decarboxylase [Microgenomates group bacterium GW2011_GWF2_45_18]|nr:MAG: Diphosphomevalonate decarboxylase [Microgenomates group bacterium GW2011_GWF1_44_10]KKU01903.1 MAG: Diphosphomevalonate decarboxylase [Microgenomates group bacterium GW2011_GWF2_45_18]OGJ40247.1 MAG: diphosphomevalonate decarboxylase [Candidatus Pacebacteria bacterium RIFOXYB1_FULL_44_10]HAU98780.1 diphosphomevalonate decarboxylase [Candidatus Paceibacterota bacterium]HAX01400.1 diphosphomevalonate decarboxylase [Candidatus Paceibacterota bacterium]